MGEVIQLLTCSSPFNFILVAQQQPQQAQQGNQIASSVRLPYTFRVARDLSHICEELASIREENHQIRHDLGSIHEENHQIRQDLGSIREENHQIRKTLEDSLPLLKKAGDTFELMVRQELRVTRGIDFARRFRMKGLSGLARLALPKGVSVGKDFKFKTISDELQV